MKHLKLFENFNEEHYRIVCITQALLSEYRFRKEVLSDIIPSWIRIPDFSIGIKDSTTGITGHFKVFVSSESIPIEEAKRILYRLKKEEKFSSIHLDFAIMDMKTLTYLHRYGFRYSNGMANYRIRQSLDISRVKYMDKDNVEFLTKIYSPEDLHSKRGTFQTRKFNF